MNAPCSGAPLTAPHVTTGGLCRWKDGKQLIWKAINKVGRHVGLDFYDLLIEGLNTQIATAFDPLHIEAFVWNRKMVGIELRRAGCRWRVTKLALSITSWVLI